MPLVRFADLRSRCFDARLFGSRDFRVALFLFRFMSCFEHLHLLLASACCGRVAFGPHQYFTFIMVLSLVSFFLSFFFLFDTRLSRCLLSGSFLLFTYSRFSAVSAGRSGFEAVPVRLFQFFMLSVSHILSCSAVFVAPAGLPNVWYLFMFCTLVRWLLARKRLL